MKMLVFLALVGLHSAAAVTHSLKYFYTWSSQVPNFPEFVTVGMVDEAQIDHYDSNTKRAVLKQDWMNKHMAEDPQYLESNTGIYQGEEQYLKNNIDTLKNRFNQTGGVHIFQRMYGCEWDDETGDVHGYDQFGYDGEDFIALDLKTQTWIAPKPQAVITKHKWDKNTGFTGGQTNYLKEICTSWLKKYVNYGRSTMQRTELPSVSLLQKTSSSSVSCYATGFYPHRADMFWRKDGQQLHENVEHGEIVPNNDGSFQMSAVLDLSSVKPEDWGKYECVFQLSGVNNDIVTKLDKAVIRTNEEKPTDMTTIIIVAVVVVALIVIAAIGFMVYKKKKEDKAKFINTPTDTGSEQSEKLNPEA